MKKKSNKKAASKKIRLGVNIDHVATLRQVRGGLTPYPDLISLMKEAVKAGADQITVHLREDRRHIQEQDLAKLSRACKVLLNLEMAVTEEMFQMALKYKPDYVCFVPEKREELTTEGGLNVVLKEAELKGMIETLSQNKIKSSMFIEPSLLQVEASQRVGAVAVEFHTGKWVHLKGGQAKEEWQRLVAAAERAHGLGLQVHAGHGLDFETTAKIKKLPYLEEVNIGHFLVCDALNEGLKKSVQKMVRVLRTGKVP